ncbi:MAG: hypothetical protein RLZZ59_342, partial [Pseudomonadota bacterium]
LCTYGKDRAEAIEKMKSALGSFVIKGIAHNMGFLEAVVSNAKFISGDMSTDFIAEEYPEGFSGVALTNEVLENFLAVATNIFMAEQKRSSSIPDQMINQANKLGTRWVVHIDDNLFPVMIKAVNDGYNIRHPSGRIYVSTSWSLGSPVFRGIVNGRNINVKIENIPTGYKLSHSGTSSNVYVRSPRISELTAIMPVKKEEESAGRITAPLTGQIVTVKVKEGDEVVQGQDLLILTAMKMENIITSPMNGKIVKLHAKDGDHVSMKQVIVEIE